MKRETCRYPLAPKPCPYPAGTEERIQCYAERVAKGFAVFHPGDDRTKIDGDQTRRGCHGQKSMAA